MRLLSGCALVTVLCLPTIAAAQSAPAAAPDEPFPTVDIIAPTPLLGSGVNRDTVPGQTQVLTGKDIALQGPPSATRALENQTQGVHLDNAAGNPFQPDLFYHGFEASPLQGTPSGLAVYLNGARFNNPFGDTVNWDLIPDLAIDRIELEGANPVFGLNALGGALNIRLKDGFTYQGGEIDVFGGSFGQFSSQFQYGKKLDDTAVYLAGSGLNEQGWRDGQSSRLRQFYGDIGWRGEQAELHVNVDIAQTVLNGPGTVPVDLLNADPRAQFTGPNAISNKYARLGLTGSDELSDTTSLQLLGYYDNLQQIVANGNGSPLAPCGGGSAYLCASPGSVATDPAGNPLAATLGPNGLYGSLAMQTTTTNGYGASLQMTNSDTLFDHANQLVAGVSFDGALTTFGATTYSGGLDPLSRDFTGPAIAIGLPGSPIAPVRAGITDAYYGIFLTDTLTITPDLTATVSGRFNVARIDIQDFAGTGLTGNHPYQRFNPAAGLTYRLTPDITIYGGYAESNRAPTPAELTCSSPTAPCSLASFFTGDPNLKQVVARTWEFGLRGGFAPEPGAKLTWNLSGFRADTSDDIMFTQSPILGTGYFQNIGTTRRQGIDAGTRLTTARWLAWIDYSYTQATFQSGFLQSSPYNPAADANGNIAVHRGDQLPGVPAHMLKLGVQYKATDEWTLGAIGVATSGQYLFGDAANLTATLPAYFRLDLNASYQVTSNIQFFVLVQNALDSRYYTYGTFSPTSSVPLAQAPGATNTRSYNIAPPLGGFAGMKVTF